MEYDFITGKQSDEMDSFPSPDELWRRLTGEGKNQIRPDIAEKLLTPFDEYSPNYFDLIMVDECHRGSARDEGNWRKILEYFEPAYQLGLTATPLRDDNVDTYRYFGNPLYTYSLKQGIEDGFLAPYRVYRVTTRSDREGWRASTGEVDRYFSHHFRCWRCG